MIPTPLEAEYDFTFVPRPIRHAYFIRSDDQLALAEVALQCCSQWGGAHSLIIPVQDSGTCLPLFEDVLQLHDPDVFVNFTADETDRSKESLGALITRCLPGRAPNVRDGSMFLDQDMSAHALTAIEAQEGVRHILFCPRLLGVPNSALHECVLFGRIPDVQETLYRKELRPLPRDIQVGSLEFWSQQFSAGIYSSPLNLTRARLRPFSVGGGMEGDHFDLVLGSTVEALCAFWCVRATQLASQWSPTDGCRTLFFPTQVASDEAIDHLHNFLSTKPPSTAGASNFDLNLIPWGDDGEELAARLLEDSRFVPLEGSRSIALNLGSQVKPRAPGPLRIIAGPPLLPKNWQEGLEIRPRPPTALTPNIGAFRLQIDLGPSLAGIRGEVAVDILSSLWRRYPCIDSLAAKIKVDGHFRNKALSFLSTANDLYRADVYLPSEWLVVETAFAPTRLRRSAPARYAAAFTELIGGIAEVDTLSSPAHVSVLSRLSLKSTKKLAQQIAKRWPSLAGDVAALEKNLRRVEPDVAIDLRGVPKNLAALQSDPSLQSWKRSLLGVVDLLCRKHLLQRGLLLECDGCGLRHWHHLSALAEEVLCPGCGDTRPLPVEYPNGSEISWEYRLNSLAERIIDQDLLCPLVSLRHATKRVSSPVCKVAGVELLGNDENAAGEIDFLFFAEDRWHAGECKTLGQLSEKDYDTALRASKIGIDVFYFCTFGTFSTETTSLISRLRASAPDLEIVTLTGAELLGTPLTS